MICKARQHSDLMVCEKCDLTWDMNDSYPPDCVVEVNFGVSRTYKVKEGKMHHVKDCKTGHQRFKPTLLIKLNMIFDVIFW